MLLPINLYNLILTNMKTNNLEAVLKQINWQRQWKGSPRLTIDSLTQVEATLVADHIFIALEPENLHCDGEISRSQVNAKRKMLDGALKELGKLGFNTSSSYSF